MRTLPALICLVVLIAPVPLALAGDDQGKDVAATELQGSWRMTGISRDGQDAPEQALKDAAVVWQVEGNRLTATQKGGRPSDRYEARLAPTPTAHPRRIKATPVDQTKGKPLIGIYEVTGDTLRIAYKDGTDPDTLPTDFTPGKGIGIMTFERVKP